MRIGQKLIISYVVIGLVSTITVVVAFLSFRNISSAFEELERGPIQTTRALGDLRKYTDEIVTSTDEIGYIYTETINGSKFEKQATSHEEDKLNAAYINFDKALIEYENTAAVSGLQNIKLFNDIEFHGARIKNLSQQFIIFKQNGGKGRAALELRKAFEQEELELIEATDAALAAEYGEMKGSQQEVMSTIAASLRTSAFATLFIFVFAISSGVLVSRSISKRLSILKNAAEEIGSGNFGTRVEAGSSDELGDLGGAFNRMAHDLDAAASELDLAAQRIKESDERWQLALRVNFDGIWDWDLRNKTFYYSPRWREMFGYEETDEINVDAYNAHQFFRPEAKDQWRGIRDQMVAGDRPYFDTEFEHRCKDGTFKWIRCRGLAILDEQTRELVRVIGLDTDISIRKRNEQEKAAIDTVLRGVSETPDLNELLRLIHEALSSVIYAENCYVAFYERKTDVLSIPFCVDQYDSVAPPAKLGRGLTAYVLRSGEPQLLSVDKVKALTESGEVAPVGTMSAIWMGVPLRTPQGTIGVLVVQHYDDPDAYDERDLRFLDAIGHHIAVAISRKRAELDLRTSERQLREAQRIASVGNWDWDMQTDVVMWSDHLYEIFGLSLDEVEPSFQSLLDISHPDDRQLLKKVLEGGLSNGGTITIDHRVIHKDGTVRHIHTNAEFTGNSDRVAIKVFGTSQDVTERKLAEETLRTSEEKHRVLFESNPLPAFVYDTQTLKFLAVNDAAVHHYGYSRDEFLDSLTLKGLWPQEKHSELSARVERVGPDSETNAAPSTHQKKDGSIVDVEVTSHAINFDGAQAEIVLINDITERKAAHEAIQESEARFRDLFDNAPVAYHELDAQGRIVRVNHTEELLLGYTNDELRGKHVSDLVLESGSREAVDEKLAGNVSFGTIERTMIRKDGTHVPVLNEDRLIYSSCGKIIGIRATLQDVSALKEAEQQLKIYNERLQQSNRELQDFAYVASHDLQEPLRKVQTFADRLGSKYSASLDETGLDYLDRMRNAASRMQTLIQDLLSFSRVTTKAQPFVPVDLEQITREVLSDLEVKIEETGAVIETKGLPRIEADPLQMRQLIQNLVGNALKFRRNDVGPVVKITGEKASQPNGSGNGNGAYRITVEDNGIGFDEKYTEKIFTVFQRLHGRTEYEGSGIGLAVCRKIVERHHGNITAHSSPGRGSRFAFTLPGRQVNTEVS
jgi:PAS domain S-box-containing protein